MGNFFTDVIQRDARFGSTQRIADINLLEPVTRGLVRTIMAASAAQGIPLILFETFRSQARQAELFAKGASTLKTVGVHHYGLSCDLVKDINGDPSWKGDFGFLGKLAHANALIWGGDWGQPAVKHSFIDADHVQRVTINRQAGLFAGTWYPDDTYNPYKDG